MFKAIARGRICQIMLDCIKCFPEKREDYKKNKQLYKNKLKHPMKRLLAELKKPEILEPFLQKALFNGEEVKYLSIESELSQDVFHVFLNKDVIGILVKKLELANSKAQNRNQTSEQKVLFRYGNRNIGEIEMRNDSNQHYREVKFRLNGMRILEILQSNKKNTHEFSKNVIVYDKAINQFKKA